MCSKLLIAPFFLFTVNFCFFVSATSKIQGGRFAADLEGNDDSTKSNETYFPQQSLENDTTNTTEEDILFWTATTVTAQTEINLDNETNEKPNEESESLEESINEAKNDTAFASQEPYESVDDETDEENKKNESFSNASSATVDSMDEKIILQRNNCHLEIMIRESQDLKIQIIFGNLESNTSGKCCITLNGEENNMLGVLITNLHLYQTASQSEVLKVVIADSGTDFILKEYNSWSKYTPLILTETHRVYIVLHYKAVKIPLNQQNSHFNLEVISYHKYDNYIQQGISDSEIHFLPKDDVKIYQNQWFPVSHFLPKNDIENSYKKQKPAFIPYFY